MPIIGPREKDFIIRMKTRDARVLDLEEADRRSIRELHIGILNLMPDGALRATEDQFLWAFQHAETSLQIHPHFIQIEGIERSAETTAYVAREYEPLSRVQEQGLDGLIITGANIAQPDLSQNAFWRPLTRVIEWTEAHVTSTLYCCLATHAYMLHKHGVQRRRMGQKLWGVYKHTVKNPTHPLTSGMDTVFYVPHSRWNDVSAEDFARSKMPVLIAGHECGVHMVTSADGLRMVGWQGHPEYDTVSLLKEWQRDYALFLAGHSETAPFFPHGYLSGEGLALAQAFRDEMHGVKMPPELEARIAAATPNRWSSSRRAMLSNWIGAILRTTHYERGKPFMEGINPQDPLGLNSGILGP